jgi:hypothetical protein
MKRVPEAARVILPCGDAASGDALCKTEDIFRAEIRADGGDNYREHPAKSK